MPGDLRLALPQYFDQIADTHLPVRNEIQQAQARSISEGRKQRDQIS